jgi:transitional endoplasmic reticulum ATPase
MDSSLPSSTATVPAIAVPVTPSPAVLPGFRPAKRASAPGQLAALCGLRLLVHALATARPGKSRAAAPAREPAAEFDALSFRQARKRPHYRHPYASRPMIDAATEVAAVLEVPFDPENPEAVRDLRERLRERLARGERAFERTGLGVIDALPAELGASVTSMAALLGLSADEQVCLAFLVLLTTDRELNRAASCLGSELDDRRADAAIAVATGLAPAAVSAALSRSGRLCGSQLIKRDRNSLHLPGKYDWPSPDFASALAEPDFSPLRALRDRVVPATAAGLPLQAFQHLGPLLDDLKVYLAEMLRQRRRGVNVLLWGVPGVGKTQLVRALAAALESELYEVSTEDSDGDPIGGPARLQALRLAQEFTGHRPALLVFDEVEDVVGRSPLAALFGGPRSPAIKGWLNRMLETNPTPTFWVTNAVEALDPAYVRRFDLVIEMKSPPQAVRAAQLRALPLEVSEATRERLAACAELTPAVVQRAAAVVQTVAAVNPGIDTSRRLELLVSQTLRAQGHRGLASASVGSAVYDRRYLNADVDPDSLVDGLRRARAGRLCLYGPPGTGKTAFAHHLAREIGLPLAVHRASDLLSPYVGEAEKQIAAAFRDAEQSGSALLIDEVDSFLQDRTRAERNWEVSQVNEFLVQMENFGGVFVASTNLMTGLDAAALRRFDLKACFSYLKPEQAEALLAAHLRAAGLAPATSADVARLRGLDVLTPGDFAMLERQQRFRPFADAAQWVDGLAAECARKPGRGRAAIGFGVSAAQA